MNEGRRSLGSELFRLGGLTAKLIYWVEFAWWDDDVGEDSAVLGRLASCVKAIAHLVDALGDAALATRARSELNRLATAAEAFFKKFKAAWLDATRRAEITRLNYEAEPEALFEAQVRLIKESPLHDPSWAYWIQVQEEFRRSLEPGFSACFTLGQMLERERHPTITGGVRSLCDSERQAYFAVEFNADLAKQMALLIEAFPCFGGLDFDLSECAGPAIPRTISRLRAEIADGLVNPPLLLPGHLGLILDEPNGRVRRGRKTGSLKGQLAWALLRSLMRNGSELTSRDALTKVLDEKRKRRREARASVTATTLREDGSLDAHLKVLRACLRTLGVTIRCERGLGWGLQEAARPQRW